MRKKTFPDNFDQFVDTHLGLVYESLDPLVEHWERHGIPYLCRTWCCGPGMPQYPDECEAAWEGASSTRVEGITHYFRCPPDVLNNTEYCEQGCYVQLPHGIIVEALCGLDEGLSGALKCLTKAQPEVFDLCSST